MQYHHFHFILDAIIIASPDLDSARLKSNQGKATEQNKTKQNNLQFHLQLDSKQRNSTKQYKKTYFDRRLI